MLSDPSSFSIHLSALQTRSDILLPFSPPLKIEMQPFRYTNPGRELVFLMQGKLGKDLAFTRTASSALGTAGSGDETRTSSARQQNPGTPCAGNDRERPRATPAGTTKVANAEIRWHETVTRQHGRRDALWARPRCPPRSCAQQGRSGQAGEPPWRHQPVPTALWAGGLPPPRAARPPGRIPARAYVAGPLPPHPGHAAATRTCTSVSGGHSVLTSRSYRIFSSPSSSSPAPAIPSSLDAAWPRSPPAAAMPAWSPPTDPASAAAAATTTTAPGGGQSSNARQLRGAAGL